MDLLSKFSGIGYEVRRQKDFNSQFNISVILKAIIAQREMIVPMLDPRYGNLRMRVACESCGLTDKNGINNIYHEDEIESFCPNHGWFSTSIDDESGRFEYNTPLRNLIRALAYSQQNADLGNPNEILRITGSDYAGFYQEQLLYKVASRLGYPAHELPAIVYAPLILDWSGAKLSKSLYVKEGAYKYLPEYLINYEKFSELLGESGIRVLFDEVSSWLDEPYRLFRHYSVYYFMELLNEKFGLEK